MSDPHPLQAGDRSSNQSRTDSSTAADRRSQEVGSIHSEEGENRSGMSPAPPMFKVGYLNPSGFLTPPYNPVFCEGDTSGEGTKCYEVDIDAYGDSYDPTAPIRVRQADQWSLDSDHDGHLN
jgi:hypothetical protein